MPVLYRKTDIGAQSGGVKARLLWEWHLRGDILSFFVQFIKNGKKQICSDMSEHMFLLYDLSVNKFRKIYNRKNKGIGIKLFLRGWLSLRCYAVL